MCRTKKNIFLMKQKSFSSLYYKQRFHLILAIKEQSQFDMNFVEILKSYFVSYIRAKSVENCAFYSEKTYFWP